MSRNRDKSLLLDILEGLRIIKCAKRSLPVPKEDGAKIRFQQFRALESVHSHHFLHQTAFLPTESETDQTDHDILVVSSTPAANFAIFARLPSQPVWIKCAPRQHLGFPHPKSKQPLANPVFSPIACASIRLFSIFA